MDERTFDRIAEAELVHLDRVLGDFDPDELEAELAAGVLTATFGNGQKLVINSHRAAGEIWMAAIRQAWHFAPHAEGDGHRWRTPKGEELHATLSDVVTSQLGRAVSI